MKKNKVNCVFILAVGISVFMLTSCGTKTLPEEADVGIEKSQEDAKEEIPEEELLGQTEKKTEVPKITLKDYSKEITSGEAIVLTISENLPEISFEKNQSAEKMIQEIYDQEKKEFDPLRKEFKNQCQEEYNMQEEGALKYWQGYEISRIYKIGRLDELCISIERDDYKNAGEDGITVSSCARNFDTASGLPLLMVDVFTSEKEARKFFTGKIIETLSGERYKELVIEDFEKEAEKVFEDTTWYFSQTGVCVICNPGIVTTKDAQVIEIEVPYEEVDCLEKRYQKEEVRP